MYGYVLEGFYRLPVERVMKQAGYAVLGKDSPTEEVLETLIDFGHIWASEHFGSSGVPGIIARKDFVAMDMLP